MPDVKVMSPVAEVTIVRADGTREPITGQFDEFGSTLTLDSPAQMWAGDRFEVDPSRPCPVYDVDGFGRVHGLKWRV